MAMRIGFQGFASGASVTLAAGAEAVTTGPGGWGVTSQAGSHTAELVVRRSELQVAPEGINFEVALDGFDTPGPVDDVNTYDPRFHNIYYFWDFGDPGSVFTAPQNIPAVHKDANVAYGPIASHTFSAPGTYTVSCLVIEPSSGKTRMAMQDVTVGDAEALFAEDRTIFVSTDPTFARAPAGARTVATGAEAITLQGTLQNADGTKMYRIMFDRDVDHTIDNSGFGAGSNNPGQLRNHYKNLWLCGAPGAGEAPLVTCAGAKNTGFIEDLTSLNEVGKRTDFTIVDLRLAGYYDTRTETMGGPYAQERIGGDVFLSIRSGRFGTYALFHDVHASGFNALYTSLATHSQVDRNSINVIFNNTTVTNWSNFAVFEADQGFSAYTGVVFVQEQEAVSGNNKTVGGVEHGPVRIQSCSKCVMDACDFFSRNGWFENTIGLHAPQPCLRWNQEGDPRGKLNMQRSTMEGGTTVLAMTRQDASKNAVINNMLIDKTAIVGGVFTGSPVQAGHVGLTVRNCLVIQAGNRKLDGAFGLGAFVDLRAQTPGDADYLDTPMRFYSNTFVNQLADDEDRDDVAAVDLLRLTTEVGADFFNCRVENNILHQPNLSTPDTAFAPVSDDTLFAPRYTDYRDWSYTSPRRPLDQDVEVGESIFIPHLDFSDTHTVDDFEHAPVNARRQHEFWAGSYQEALYAFDEAGVTITNNDTGPWSAGSDHRAILTGTALNIRPEYATPPDSVITAAPLPGSSAIGAAISGLRALDDFYGQQRPEYPSIGAFEVAG